MQSSKNDVVSEFFLTEDQCNFAIMGGAPRWVDIALGDVPALGLALPAEQTLVSPELRLGKDTALLCELTSGRAHISFRMDGEDEELLALRAGGAVTLDLRALEGRSGRVSVRAEEDVVLTKLLIGRLDRLGLLSARTHHARRVANEKRHFATVYDHPMYDIRGPRGGAGTFEAPPRRGRIQALPQLTVEELEKLPCSAPRQGDDAYHYAHHVLGEIIGVSAPNFAERLGSIYKKRPVRMLSLCSGTAGIERGILEAAGVPIEITLFDINENLLAQAADVVAPYARAFGVAGDVNTVSTAQFATRFDVVAFVSGLHHVVELEHVLQTVSSLLEEQGEFWLIGEQIGRNGNRLWPESREVVDRLFATLPEPFRRNAHSGAIDNTMPDSDFSSVTFEGIRSSEIEPMLLRYFEPVQIYRRNCFLWRMVEPTYIDNYDVSNEEHRRTILRIVAAEYNLWRDGGRSTEMHAVYRRR